MPNRPPRVRPKNRTQDVTIDRIAAEAGVSAATISRYFNNPQMLSPGTASRVREVVDRHAFVPNLLAGGLASSRTQVVAVVIPTISNSIFSSTVQAISDSLARQEFGVVLALSGAHDEYVDRQLTSTIGHRPNGIILTGATLDSVTRARLLSSGIPTIETWDLPVNPMDMVVGFSHEAVGRTIGRFVVRSGRKRVLIVSAGGARAIARRAGLAGVLRRHRLPQPAVVSFPGQTTFGHGRIAIAEHLDSGGKPDLVICSSDWAAHGVLDELRRRRINVPRDIGVVGFGDLGFAAELDPPLTTVRIDGSAIGAHAATMLMKRAQGQRVGQKVVDVGFDLVLRATT